MKKKKLTAADRPEFRRQAVDMMSRLGVTPAKVAEVGVIVCTNAEDFDPSTNVLWELDANKSAVRPDVTCFNCKKTVAMSNDMFRQYTALDKRPRVCCTRCLSSLGR